MLFMDFILGFSLFFFRYINLFLYFVVIKLLNLWFYFPCWKFSFHTLLQTCDLCTETHGREGAAGTGVPAGEARSRYFLDKMVLRDLLLFYTLCDSTINTN